MTTSDEHVRYEELVVGHALSALEPEDEQDLLRHLPSCAACERDLAAHRQTLSHLAYAADPVAPPAGLWEGIRREVMAESGPSAFAPQDLAPAVRAALTPAAVAEVVPLDRARRERAARAGRVRAAGWLSAAAAVALVLSLTVWNVSLQRDRDRATDAAGSLTAAVQTLESGRTVPLKGQDGQVRAIAVVHADAVDLVVDGITPNDPATSTYVLWGKRGDAPAQALKAFDVTAHGVLVLRDLPVLAGAVAAPDVLAITREPGRTAPAVSQQIAVAAGRAT